MKKTNKIFRDRHPVMLPWYAVILAIPMWIYEEIKNKIKNIFKKERR